MLLATARETGELIARVNDRELSLSDSDQNAAITAIHQLLHQEKILFDTEGAGL